MRGINDDPQAVLVGAAWQNIDEASNRREWKFMSVGRRVTPPDNFYESLTSPRVGFTVFAVLRSVWQRVRGFSEYLKYAGDWELWLRLAPEGNLIYEPKIFSFSIWAHSREPARSVLKRFKDLRLGVP
jgi:hypothetical protein